MSDICVSSNSPADDTDLAHFILAEGPVPREPLLSEKDSPVPSHSGWSSARCLASLSGPTPFGRTVPGPMQTDPRRRSSWASVK
ncbi:hypothetical protein NHX12_019120 [Muraenolepis orangiensis]|uniref:Uncharacterized protein n=1 Tax=Muraenolepis orangiensis TaxID=630683 RepID=A0A9Q0EUS2_9TELE|nr:hypothetical protein NHX12_019120 [Muraenolepis orangiensis]